MHGKILLIVVLGVLAMAGLVTFLFFWHVWRGPRSEEISEEKVADVLEYGWKTRVRNGGKKVRRVLRTMKSARLRKSKVGDEKGEGNV